MSTNTIDLSQTVHQTVQEHPEIKEFLVELGFKPLANPLMFNTIARKTSIIQGAKLIGLSLKEIQQQLEWNGYEVIGVDEDD
ncbi:DUF1858 domain-containing protein [Tuanshanicoccus lijuaniae]|uniref:DUF1858 domain-containing protein n=1 Tax=Aerococcaceae bacterium zg-1292 TaxID=2774330 RepID=UPI0019358501|nr:DUF1858 domain-containing protein [Aerococcaceae bacterium zg-1292]MBF6626664.1 DUF1858 domain-containing protein [Aerococcaceae bacterium zg-BR9]MBF6977625.1 DUF1858 domain-containing protein [Aerococcaceae bacterium zg-BR22]MBS4456982.1 DUF1858 domain-containing protein [Aerococcaceae bacterium zg-A91]MBS4458832.1 DUF1858 domain-containing protein [Aerococcaceae bacterium zg-BR33]